MKRYCAIALAALMITTIFVGNILNVSADSDDGTMISTEKSGISDEISYDEYRRNNVLADNGIKKDIDINIQSAVTDGNGTVKNDIIENREALSFTSGSAFAEWTFNAEIEGWYDLTLSYCPINGLQENIQIAVYINGVIPFSESEHILLKRQYADDSEITKDSYGNDIRPYKHEVFEWNKETIKDRDGIYSEPLCFYLKAGVNTVRVTLKSGKVAIGAIRFSTVNQEPDYNAYTDKFKNNSADNSSQEIIIQGENYHRITDTGISATCDRQSPLTQSSDNSLNSPSNLCLNTIGQGTWNLPGQKITWQFDVEKDGFYEIGMRVRQNQARGMFTTREVLIDGELPFSELRNVRVDYVSDWQIKIMGDDAPYLFYLSKGVHTISMEAVANETGIYVQKLKSLLLKLNTLYRKTIMVTGTSPDPYRDYNIDSEIPDILTDMEEYVGDLRSIMRDLQSLGIQSSSDMIVAEQLAAQLESFIKNPRSIVIRLSNFQDNISSMASWILSLTQQPLELDYIFIQQGHSQERRANATAWQTLTFRAKNFLNTFVNDYSKLSDDKAASSNKLNVWISLGRDQSQIVKDMIDSDFTPQSGITVNLSLVQQGIVEAIAADRAPDVLMYGGDIINLAARNALLDMSTMQGFDEVSKQFGEKSLVPYTYNNGVYALPLSQDFSMMFYRTDIFEELQLKVPETWEEFYETICILQKKNLNVGVPVGTAAAADTRMFSIFLYQAGGSYYNSDFSATLFDSEISINAFTKWTEFYTNYRLPQTYTLLTRFRSGEMPLAIENFSTYSTFAVAAPEISGLWEMVPLPGTVDENGNINRTSIGNSVPITIFSTCDNEEAAFDFVKWFVSPEAQEYYGKTVESVLGAGARYSSANIEAFSNTNWSEDELQMLLAQMETLNYVPVIPATYYVNRNLTNAYRAVTIKGLNPREALYSYNIEINNEIDRKRQEIGLGE